MHIPIMERLHLVQSDGMSGLHKGELASAAMLRMLSAWFEMEFPELLYRGLRMETLKESWNHLIRKANEQFQRHGKRNSFKMGTTMVAVLLAGKTYYICNVGDSRVYRIKQHVELLTKDQTFVQQEIDSGRMTSEQSNTDIRRNILLQCVGASHKVKPDYYTGTIESGTVFLLCSDGFRHVVSEEELLQSLTPKNIKNEYGMKIRLLAEKALSSGEVH